eukprot:TRINITY_DN67867_c0_g3_i4.p1 TRINITY_DN67867_c0_g3~~TRINITY_DN67867_c0_g3_i4.p1  ORF type:complete len:118 (+),score=3.15 TRINITY_DN67867_c0_g3_i4:486-839(+)
MAVVLTNPLLSPCALSAFWQVVQVRYWTVQPGDCAISCCDPAPISYSVVYLHVCDAMLWMCNLIPCIPLHHSLQVLSDLARTTTAIATKSGVVSGYCKHAITEEVAVTWLLARQQVL